MFVVTVQANGETVGVGAGCLPTWGLVVAGVDPAMIDRVVQEYVNAATATAGSRTEDTSDPVDGDVDDPGDPLPFPGDGVPASPPSPGQDPAAAQRPSAAAGSRRRRPRSAEDQQRRTRAALAARPDAARTSADVIPDPQER